MAKRKAAKRPAATSKRAGGRKKAARKTARRTAARKTAKRQGRPARKTARATAKKRVTPKKKVVAKKKVAARKTVAARKRVAPKKVTVARRAPALNRARRTIVDDDLVQTPPSSLDLDRTASAVRTGRQEMKQRYDLHTETSPALTAGDVDADWESAYSVGDEAPGGDNPTPDQDIVDEIGRAVGVQYEDNEELKGEKKISDRDAHRWELDPASAEDYNEHDED
jgi:hypothetical protein